MTASLPPALILMGGALVVPFLPGRVKKLWLLFLAAWTLWICWSLPEGVSWRLPFLDLELVLLKVDGLSRVFGLGFALVFLLGVLYSLPTSNDLQHLAALFYAGGALGVTFAGDFFSLYLFWEVMAVASTFLILAAREPLARGAAFRYVMMHLLGGLVLLAGILLRYQEVGHLRVELVGLGGLSGWLIFLGVGLNAALPGLHAWLPDAYPRATVAGAVFLCAFTTKSAVYLMARTFAGSEVLIYLGAFMALFTIIYGLLADDLRLLLAYSLISQVGYMMVGVGIGTPLAINGAAAHAFCHLLYKALLFMGAGSILHITGRRRLSELGGLYRRMPLTTACTLVGVASISALPLFSGFVSKSLIISAAGHGHLAGVWLALEAASAGVMVYLGMKLPWFAFFGRERGLKPKDPPWPMGLAMLLAAALCVAVAVWPRYLYDLLPYPVSYQPYTISHVLGSLLSLGFGGLAFVLALKAGLYPLPQPAQLMDADWLYRRGGALIYRLADRGLNAINAWCDRVLAQGLSAWLGGLARNAPERVALAIMTPCWRLQGLRGETLQRRRQGLARAVKRHALPSSLGAAAAVAMLLVLFVLASRSPALLR